MFDAWNGSTSTGKRAALNAKGQFMVLERSSQGHRAWIMKATQS